MGKQQVMLGAMDCGRVLLGAKQAMSGARRVQGRGGGAQLHKQPAAGWREGRQQGVSGAMDVRGASGAACIRESCRKACQGQQRGRYTQSLTGSGRQKEPFPS